MLEREEVQVDLSKDQMDDFYSYISAYMESNEVNIIEMLTLLKAVSHDIVQYFSLQEAAMALDVEFSTTSNTLQ